MKLESISMSEFSSIRPRPGIELFYNLEEGAFDGIPRETRVHKRNLEHLIRLIARYLKVYQLTTVEQDTFYYVDIENLMKNEDISKLIRKMVERRGMQIPDKQGHIALLEEMVYRLVFYNVGSKKCVMRTRSSYSAGTLSAETLALDQSCRTLPPSIRQIVESYPQIKLTKIPSLSRYETQLMKLRDRLELCCYVLTTAERCGGATSMTHDILGKCYIEDSFGGQASSSNQCLIKQNRSNSL